MKVLILFICLFCSIWGITQINQNFDAGNFLPTGWSEYHSGVNALKDTNERSYSSSKSALFDDEFGTDTSWMVVSQITSLPANSELSFWQNQNYDTYYIYHGVWVSTSNGNPLSGNFIQLDSLGAGTEDVWEQKTIDLSAYSGQDIYIAFVYIGDFADEWYIDNVKVNQATCLPPTNISSNNITFNSINLSWTPQGGELYWKIEYGLSGFIQGTGTTINSSSTQITIPNLLSNTYYDHYISAICPSSITGTSSPVFTDKTICLSNSNLISIPYSEGFEIVSTPSLPCGWTQADINNDSVEWKTDSTNPNNGLNSAFITYTNSSSINHDDWLFSPYFMVTDTTTEYKVGFSYTSKSGSAFPEKMEFYTTKNNNGTALKNLIFRDTAILTNNIYNDTSFIFKFKDTGKHYFGFHVFSDGNQWHFMMDDFYFESTTPIGINERTKDNEVVIFPNPTQNEINIKASSKIEKAYLYNSSGKLLEIFLVNNSYYNISLKNYKKGLYLISIKTEKGIINKRIIRE